MQKGSRAPGVKEMSLVGYVLSDFLISSSLTQQGLMLCNAMSWCPSPTLYGTGQRWQRYNINKIWDWGAEHAVGCSRDLTELGNDSLEYEIPGKMEFQQIQESEHGSCDSLEVSCHLKKIKEIQLWWLQVRWVGFTDWVLLAQNLGLLPRRQ